MPPNVDAEWNAFLITTAAASSSAQAQQQTAETAAAPKQSLEDLIKAQLYRTAMMEAQLTLLHANCEAAGSQMAYVKASLKEVEERAQERDEAIAKLQTSLKEFEEKWAEMTTELHLALEGVRKLHYKQMKRNGLVSAEDKDVEKDDDDDDDVAEE
ncbi:hypothetical protein QBC43DRAFT_332572 [Cladorrhinum sp. PSN259]|nr:hypothetical protein QBC43DRAFT_332572 [Cladorrhinum sp. PSN259]